MVDYHDATRILEQAWIDIGNPSLVPSSGLKDKIETIMGTASGAKGFKYLLVTGTLAKTVEPDVHPRSIQAGSSLPGAYDARSLCHKVVVPFEKSKGNLFGLSNEPFVGKSLRRPEHDKDNTQLKNKKISIFLHDALELVRVAPESETYAALVHILRLGKKRSELTTVAPSAGEHDFAICSEFVQRFLLRASGGARLVALWGAMLQLSDEDSDVRAYNPNQSDEFSGTIGDVEVFIEGELVSASECKHRPINLEDVEHGLRKNTFGVEYVFVVASGFESHQEAKIRTKIEEAGRVGDVLLVEAQSEFVTMLKMLGPHRRRQLGSTVAALLRKMREFETAEDAVALWTQLLEE